MCRFCYNEDKAAAKGMELRAGAPTQCNNQNGESGTHRKLGTTAAIVRSDNSPRSLVQTGKASSPMGGDETITSIFAKPHPTHLLFKQ